MTSQETPHTGNSSVTVGVNVPIQSVKQPISLDLVDSTDSFQSALQEVSTQTLSNEDSAMENSGGNNFPAKLTDSDELAEMTAETGHINNTSQVVNADSGITSERVDSDYVIQLLPSQSIKNVEENQLINDAAAYNDESNSEEYSAADQLVLSAYTQLSQDSEIDNADDAILSNNKLTNNQGLTRGVNQSPLSTNLDSTQTLRTDIATSKNEQVSSLLNKVVNTAVQDTVKETKLNSIERIISDTVTKNTESKTGLVDTNHPVEPKLQATVSAELETTTGALKQVQLKQTTEINHFINKANPVTDNQGVNTSGVLQTVAPESSEVSEDLIAVNDVLINTKKNDLFQNNVSKYDQQFYKASNTVLPSTLSQVSTEDVIEQIDRDLTLASKSVTANQDEINLTNSAALNSLTSQLRSVLQAKPDYRNSLNEKVSVSLSDNSIKIDNSLIQSMDELVLPDESTGLIPEKIKNFLSMLNQQQSVVVSQATQVASLGNNSVSSADDSLDTLPELYSTTVNTVTNTNMLSLPKAEITEFFGRAAWPQAMGKQVISMINQNLSSAEIKLNPAHLGPIEILIDLSDDQVSVSFSSRHAVVRDAMEMALPKLREMLDENGFNLADADISQQSFSEQREQDSEKSEHVSRFTETENHQPMSLDTPEPHSQGRKESTATVDYFI